MVLNRYVKKKKKKTVTDLIVLFCLDSDLDSLLKYVLSSVS